MSTFYIVKNDNDLLHYGVLGMKWGVRRYQNANGKLTMAGKIRYGNKNNRTTDQLRNRLQVAQNRKEAMALVRQGDKASNLKKLKRIRTLNSIQGANAVLNSPTSGVGDIIVGVKTKTISNIIKGMAKMTVPQISALPVIITNAQLDSLINSLEKEIELEKEVYSYE